MQATNRGCRWTLARSNSSPDFLFAGFLQQGFYKEGTDLKLTYTTQSRYPCSYGGYHHLKSVCSDYTVAVQAFGASERKLSSRRLGNGVSREVITSQNLPGINIPIIFNTEIKKPFILSPSAFSMCFPHRSHCNHALPNAIWPLKSPLSGNTPLGSKENLIPALPHTPLWSTLLLASLCVSCLWGPIHS